MQYLLIHLRRRIRPGRRADRRGATKMNAAYTAYTQAMIKAGVMLAGERLKPSSNATTIVKSATTRPSAGRSLADTKEQLAGFYMIDVPDIDEAINWAARCPGATHGTIEVRPVWPMQAG